MHHSQTSGPSRGSLAQVGYEKALPWSELREQLEENTVLGKWSIDDDIISRTYSIERFGYHLRAVKRCQGYFLLSGLGRSAFNASFAAAVWHRPA